MAIEDGAVASHVYELQTGERTDYPDVLISGWLSGDRLILIERDGAGVRLVVKDTSGNELTARRFDGTVAAKPSPDRERFFVTLKTEEDRWFGFGFFPSLSGSGLDEFFVCDGTEWTDLRSLIDALEGENVWVAWGGPNTLVASNNTGNAIADARSGARWTVVTGD